MDSRTVQLLLATGNEQTVTDQTCSLAKVANERKLFIVTVNPLLPPPPNKPSLFRGRPPLYFTPPPLLLSTNKIYYDRLYSSTTTGKLHLA